MALRLQVLCEHLITPCSVLPATAVQCSARGSGLYRGYSDNLTPGLDVSVSQDGVATLRLSNERARNPLSKVILERLHEILVECASMHVTDFKSASSAPVKCIVISSTGPTYSTGHDMKDFTTEVSSDNQAATLDLCARVNILLSCVPQPTVALVDGHAIAGGCQLAASCDLLFATDRSKFALSGVRSKEGFCHTPGVAVAAKIGRKALRFVLLGDDVSALDAKALGLVDIIGDLEALNNNILTLSKQFDNQMALGKRAFFEYIRKPALEEMYGVATPVMETMMRNSSERFTKFLAGKRRQGVTRNGQ